MAFRPLSTQRKETVGRYQRGSYLGVVDLPRYVARGDDATPVGYHDYRSTALRHPKLPLVPLPQGLTEITGPLLGHERVRPQDANLTVVNGGEALGQRIIVSGRVLDSDGRPVPDTLIEVWQANAAGRYRHERDQWPAPLDPHFNGEGRMVTDAQGRYSFTSIKPGAYPWKNHYNAWRPAHIHFSLFGRAFTQRLVTQMYFPGDPLFFQDPIFNAAPERARPTMISTFNLERTRPEWALAFDFDIILRGRGQTYFEPEDAHAGAGDEL